MTLIRALVLVIKLLIGHRQNDLGILLGGTPPQVEESNSSLLPLETVYSLGSLAVPSSVIHGYSTFSSANRFGNPLTCDEEGFQVGKRCIDFWQWYLLRSS